MSGSLFISLYIGAFWYCSIWAIVDHETGLSVGVITSMLTLLILGWVYLASQQDRHP